MGRAVGRAVLATTWDVVLVDAPMGFADDSPGRAAPLYTAAYLLRTVHGRPRHVAVHVHDVYREVRMPARLPRPAPPPREALRWGLVCVCVGDHVCLRRRGQLESNLTRRFFPGIALKREHSLFSLVVPVLA